MSNELSGCDCALIAKVTCTEFDTRPHHLVSLRLSDFKLTSWDFQGVVAHATQFYNVTANVQDVMAEEEERDDEQPAQEEVEDLEREMEELECDSIEHTDSYDLQLQFQRSKEEETSGNGDLEVVDAEESLTSLGYDPLTTDDRIDDDVAKSASEEDKTASPIREERERVEEAGLKEESVVSLLEAERSVASDIISQAMIKAVQRVTTP